MVFSHHPDNLFQHAVFNLHSKTWHIVPPPAQRMKMEETTYGMIVNTSEILYTFKLILGSKSMKTQIYDSKSRSWSKRSFKLGRASESPSASCLCTNGNVYISREMEMVLVYSIESDIWTTLQGPQLEEIVEHNRYALGVWEGRIFTTREIENEHVSVWELVDESKQEWVEYARTSEEAYGWLDYHFASIGPHVMPEEVQLVSCFCNEYLLIYFWMFNYGRADGYVLFNLATKEWKKVDLPVGTVLYETEY